MICITLDWGMETIAGWFSLTARISRIYPGIRAPRHTENACIRAETFYCGSPKQLRWNRTLAERNIATQCMTIMLAPTTGDSPSTRLQQWESDCRQREQQYFTSTVIFDLIRLTAASWGCYVFKPLRGIPVPSWKNRPVSENFH